MPRIRNEQMTAFEKAQSQGFENWMLVHLRQFFPQRLEPVSDSELRELIRHGVARTRMYGIIGQRDVCKYTDLLVVFGKDLDRDRRYRWASEILRQPAEPSARIAALQDAAMNQLSGGPQ